MEEQKKEQVTSDWIKKVQARSWEIELFVSGGSLFSLMQLSEVVLEFVPNSPKLIDGCRCELVSASAQVRCNSVELELCLRNRDGKEEYSENDSRLHLP